MIDIDDLYFTIYLRAICILLSTIRTLKVCATDFLSKFLREFTRAILKRHSLYSTLYRVTRQVLFQTPRCAANRDNLIFEEVQGGSIGCVFEVNGAYEMDTEGESKGALHARVFAYMCVSVRTHTCEW